MGICKLAVVALYQRECSHGANPSSPSSFGTCETGTIMLSSVAVAFVLASCVLARPTVTVRNSPITLSFARRINATGIQNLLKIDQARAKEIKNQSKAQRHNATSAAVFGVPATNQVVDYILSVG